MAEIHIDSAKHLATVARDLSQTNSPLFLVYDQNGDAVLLTDRIGKAGACARKNPLGKIVPFEKGIAGEIMQGPALDAISSLTTGQMHA